MPRSSLRWQAWRPGIKRRNDLHRSNSAPAGAVRNPPVLGHTQASGIRLGSVIPRFVCKPRLNHALLL
jgi:hypothetical protein